MDDSEVQGYLAQMAALQREMVEELADLPQEAFRYETTSPRWTTVRRVLLRLGDHVREHATQLIAAREDAGAMPTMTQRILAQSQQAYGYLLGAAVGLQDADLDRSPQPGEWSPRQVLEHLVQTQRGYLETIREACARKVPVERD